MTTPKDLAMTHKQLLAYVISAIGALFLLLLSMGSNRPTTEEVRNIVADRVVVPLDQINGRLDRMDKRLERIADKVDPPREGSGTP